MMDLPFLGLVNNANLFIIEYKHKAYDGSMLRVMSQVRCKKDAARPECAEGKE